MAPNFRLTRQRYGPRSRFEPAAPSWMTTGHLRTRFTGQVAGQCALVLPLLITLEPAEVQEVVGPLGDLGYGNGHILEAHRTGDTVHLGDLSNVAMIRSFRSPSSYSSLRGTRHRLAQPEVPSSTSLANADHLTTTGTSVACNPHDRLIKLQHFGTKRTARKCSPTPVFNPLTGPEALRWFCPRSMYCRSLTRTVHRPCERTATGLPRARP